jgi:hypothetical protein
MLDQVLSLIPPTLLNALGTGAATVPATWGLIEYVLRPDSSKITNRLVNVGANTGAFFLLHASGQVTFGPDWHGYLAAATYGLLSAGLTEMFHGAVKKVAPGAMRPSGG